MIGTECIFSEYSLKARITLMLLIWLERLRFLVSSQHSSVCTTGLTVLAITRLQTVWEEVLHALRLTRLSVCRTCGRASDPKGCASSQFWKQRLRPTAFYLFVFPNLPVMMICSQTSFDFCPSGKAQSQRSLSSDGQGSLLRGLERKVAEAFQ